MDDLTQHSPYSLVDTATMGPGVDFITRSPVGPFIDAGITVHRFNLGAGASHERLYLSVETLREMATQAGLLNAPEPEEHSDPDYPPATADYARGYLDALKEALGNDLDSALDTLGFLVDRLRELHRVRATPRPRVSEDTPRQASTAELVAEADGAALAQSAKRAAGVLAGLDFPTTEQLAVDGSDV